MIEQTTLARPYARAIFEVARQHDALAKWSVMLHACAAIVADPSVQALVGDPRVSRQQLTELLLDVAGDRLDEQGRNVLRLLVENRRLPYLTEIAALYETCRREAERAVEAQVISAFPLDEEQQRRIAAALEKRLGRTVTLAASVDESLLGGMVIRTQDRVIDGSVTAQLDRLTRALAG